MAKEYDPYAEFAGAMTEMLTWIEKQKGFSGDKVDTNVEKALQQLEDVQKEFDAIAEKMAEGPAKEKVEHMTQKRQRVLEQLSTLKREIRMHEKALERVIEQEKKGTETKDNKPTKKQVRRRRKKLKKAGGKGGWLKT